MSEWQDGGDWEYYMAEGKQDFQKDGENNEDLDDPTISEVAMVIQKLREEEREMPSET